MQPNTLIRIQFYCMKQTKLTLLFLLFAFAIYAQKATVNPYANVDKKALQLQDSLTHTTADIAKYIRENFKTDKEKPVQYLFGQLQI